MRNFPPQITPHLRLGLRLPTVLRALRHRNFRLFFFGQLVSLSGSWMQTTAQQWLVYRLTGSQLSLGTVTFVSFLPVLLLSLFMGVIVDRLPRRRILLFTQTTFMLLAGILALITYLGVVRFEHILLLALPLGIANALDMPTRQAFFMDMVEREDLLNAIALNSSVFNGARIIGPAIGGFIVASIGEAPAFAINALSYLAVIFALIMMRLPPFSALTERGGGRDELIEGLRYLLSEKRVLGLVTMVALFSLFGFPYSILLPAIASDLLGIGAEGYGGLLAAQGIGALSGALALAATGDRRHKGRQLSMNRWLLALSLFVLSLSREWILSASALIIAGYSMITQLAITNTLIQLIVPDKIRGRVISTYTWALGGFWPLGALFMGALADWLSTSQAILIGAGCCAVLSIVGPRLFPESLELS